MLFSTREVLPQPVWMEQDTTYRRAGNPRKNSCGGGGSENSVIAEDRVDSEVSSLTFEIWLHHCLDVTNSLTLKWSLT